ncbi:MAG: penicillin-binding protein 2 [Desulfobacterales bacterium]|nr:penicillin-binding protein 2 [Desulfobacterales bacterium]
MKQKTDKNQNMRIILIGVIFSLGLAAIGIKATYIQVLRGTWLTQKAERQYEKSITTQGKRGAIYDKNMNEMAVSIDAVSVAAYPAQIEDVQKTAIALAKILELKRSELVKKLSDKRSFVWIKRKVTPSESAEIKTLKLAGIGFIPETCRFYPGKTLAAQVLGFSGLDGHGLEGLEFYYDSYLRGETDKRTVLTDALGRGFETEKVYAATGTGGSNIVLTIDRNVQYIAEKALEEAATKYSAKSGMAIVMVPKTGAILALAHFPLFNPNAFERFSREDWRNRLITDPFEPGSTMKIFSTAAALESGICTPDTIFFCENGEYRIGPNTVHDTHDYGWLSVQQIVKFSSNIGSIKISESIGAARLHKTYLDFGFGEKTGIECPGESNGSLSHYSLWKSIDTGAISFGQGVSVSALQLVTAASAIANDGVLMKPYIVQAITDTNEGLIKSFGPEVVRRAISAKTAMAVKRIMATVVTEGGTGGNAALEGYRVCGKTGTAQKIDKSGTYAKDKYIASFVGFVPEQNPEFAILVVVDEPHGNHYGGIVAGPAFKKIALETLSYFNVSPEKNAEKLTVSIIKEALRDAV